MSTIITQRLHHQRLAQQKLSTPAEVVAWFGAVQAQEYALAKWALNLRLQTPTTDEAIEQAFNAGEMLRTHVMRPTWHFVAPADIRWLLELTAPRVNIVNGHMYRKLELDDTLFGRSNEVIARALEGGQQLTREELGAALGQVGILAEGMRLGYLVHRAELDAVVCSGARRGKQFTYALLAERAPQAQSLPRDVALAELTKRFFTSHGLAMIKDFVWWSGLTVADVKAGLKMCEPYLVESVIEGKAYWHSATLPPEIESPLVLLLPPYDEYTIAYKDTTAILNPDHIALIGRDQFMSFYTINGHIEGMWRRTLSKKMVTIETKPFRPLTPVEKEAFEEAAQRFGEFVNLRAVVEF